MKVIFVLALLGVSSVASAQSVCRGRVALPGGGFREVHLSQPVVIEGSRMSLWHPITEDFEAGVSLIIQRVMRIRDGQRVLAIYDEVGMAGILSFEMVAVGGRVLLRDFKGFEGVVAFGPGEAECREE